MLIMTRESCAAASLTPVRSTDTTESWVHFMPRTDDVAAVLFARAKSFGNDTALRTPWNVVVRMHSAAPKSVSSVRTAPTRSPGMKSFGCAAPTAGTAPSPAAGGAPTTAPIASA
jgi:hypothetical protein